MTDILAVDFNPRLDWNKEALNTDLNLQSLGFWHNPRLNVRQ